MNPDMVFDHKVPHCSSNCCQPLLTPTRRLKSIF